MRFRLIRLMARGTQVNTFVKGLKGPCPALSLSIIFCSLSVILCLIPRIGLCACMPGVSMQEIRNISDKQKSGVSLDFPIKGIQKDIPLSLSPPPPPPPPPLLPDFFFKTISSTECAPKEISLNALALPSTSQECTGIDYLWDFGDDTPIKAGGEMTHTYARPGEYTITLTVTLSNGLTRSRQKKLSVLNPLQAYFTVSGSKTGIGKGLKTGLKSLSGSLSGSLSEADDTWEGYAPLTVNFDASGSSLLTGVITDYHWDFKDNCQGVGRTITHTFALHGTYEVALTVSDRNNISHTVKKSIIVLNPIHPAFLVVPGSGPSSTLFSFDASKSSFMGTDFKSVPIKESDAAKSSSSSSSSSKSSAKSSSKSSTKSSSKSSAKSSARVGKIISYEWDFGDERTATGPRVTHRYDSEGYKTVKLTLKNEHGISATLKKPVTVGPGPYAFISNQTIDCDTIWSPYHVYVLSGSITIAAGTTLTIEPGTVIKGGSHSSRLIVHGALVAKGTKRAPIIFTSLQDDTSGGDTNADGNNSYPAAGDWDGIFFYNTGNDSACVLDNCIIRYAGYGSQGCAISLSSASPGVRYCTISHNRICGLKIQDASPTISNCSISHNGYSGILTEGNSSPVITGCNIYKNNVYGIYSLSTATVLITGNTFAGNGTYAAYLCCTRSISIFRNTISDYCGGICLTGTISANARLGNNPGCPYILNNLTVAEGATLTLEPGAVIKGDIQYGRLAVNGALVAKGTKQSPIIFTSLRDDTCEGDTNNDGSNSSPAAGDWDGIFFYNTGNELSCVLDHCKGMGTDSHCKGMRTDLKSVPIPINGTIPVNDTSNGSACVMDHCLVRYAGCGSQGCGISFSNASPSVSHCTVSHNRTCGLRLQDASPAISNCTITYNSHSGILIEGNSNPVISGCDIDNNSAYGICSWGTSSPVITANTFADNGFYAVSACCTRSVSISDNNVNGNGGGMYIQGTIIVDTRLANNPDCSYVLNNLTIAKGAALTIEPGIVIKGSRQCNQIIINGGGWGATWGNSVMDGSGVSVTNGSGVSPAAAIHEVHEIDGPDDQPKLRWR